MARTYPTIVCGLGNPDAQYARTRHNAGFAVVDALAQRQGVRYWRSEAGAQTATVTVSCADGERREVLLAKPMSYMNTSGGPLSKLARAHHARPRQILVVHDEVDLAAGEVRVKLGGGLNAHNGLRSIADKLGSRDFARVQLGIGLRPARAQGGLPSGLRARRGARGRRRGGRARARPRHIGAIPPTCPPLSAEMRLHSHVEGYNYAMVGPRPQRAS